LIDLGMGGGAKNIEGARRRTEAVNGDAKADRRHQCQPARGQ
jgi:hypothetical protein